MGTVALSEKDMNGLKVVNLGDGEDPGDVVNLAQMQAGDDAAKSRANHTGTQIAATISDFNTAVRTNRPEQLATPTGPLGMGSQRITTLADPTSAQDAATRAYVDAAIATLSGGLVFKGAVRAATASNVSISSAPATIDGVTPNVDDVFLLTGQSTGAENGPRVWTAAGAAMARPSNWDTDAEAVPGSLWVVRQGTFDNQLAILSNDTFDLDTDTATFVFLNPASAADNDTGYTETCPSTSAGAAWAVNHNLGTKAVEVSVYRTASPFDEIRDITITRDTTNQVNVRPDVALASGEFTVIVSKVV